jgi:hypothetical protein
MAYAVRETVVANPARKRKRKNVARRMSLKQKLHFGTKRQRAAAKTSLKAKRKKPVKAHRRRKINPAPRKRKAATRNHRRRTRRTNPGEIIAMTLGNPARKKGKKKNMAAKKHRRRRKNAAPVHHRRRRRSNPAAGRRRAAPRRTTRRRSYRSNPGGFAVKDMLWLGTGSVAGASLSKLATQAVLGASNTGAMGYLGNVVATGILAFLGHKFIKNKSFSAGVVAGGIGQVITRAIGDNTSYGQYLAMSGMGDYQASAFVTPQRLSAGLTSAQIAIPNGWGGQSLPANVNGAQMSSGDPGWD